MNFKREALAYLKKNKIFVDLNQIELERVINVYENIVKCSTFYNNTTYVVTFDYITQKMLYIIFMDKNGHGVVVDSDKKYQVYMFPQQR